jgi:hypothetical protein
MVIQSHGKNMGIQVIIGNDQQSLWTQTIWAMIAAQAMVLHDVPSCPV